MSLSAASSYLRKTAAALWTLALIVILCGCGKDSSHYGADPALSGPPISTSEALQPQYFDRTVQIAATIHAVCKNEGCWIGISDGKKNIGVLFYQSAFAAPLDCVGKSIILEGRMVDRIFTVSDVQKFDAEAGANHDFCLLGEDNCGQRRSHNDKSKSGADDRRTQIFEATSMTIFN